jgi:hypothetical protein
LVSLGGACYQVFWIAYKRVAPQTMLVGLLCHIVPRVIRHFRMHRNRIHIQMLDMKTVWFTLLHIHTARA